MASYFYYVKGMDVVVVDCDYPQYSIKDMRERDIKNIERNPRLKKNGFRSVCQSTEKNVSHSREPSRKPPSKRQKDFIAMETPPDIIFFDLPGTVKQSRRHQYRGDNGLRVLPQ